MIRTFEALRTVDPGFTQPATIQTARIAIPPTLEPNAEKVLASQRARGRGGRANPERELGGLATAVPMDGNYGMWDGISVEDQPRDPNATTSSVMRRYRYVPPVCSARPARASSRAASSSGPTSMRTRPVALVSENLARELWGSPEAALGKRIRGGPAASDWRDIVGVVQDTRDNGVEAAAPTTAYCPRT